MNRALMSGFSTLALVAAMIAAGVGLLVGSLPEGDPWDLWAPFLRALTFGGALVFAFIALVIRYASHPPSGRIIIDDEGITLDNPAVFRRPVRIPRTTIRSVSVERDVPALIAQMPLELFPVEAGAYASDRDKHLISRRRAHYLLPGINPDPVSPNLAVVLEGMAEVSPIRFRGSLFPGYSPVKPPLWVRRIPGFFARVSDVETAAMAFERWGVLRPPRTEELKAARDAFARQRRVQIVLAIGVFIAALFVTDVVDP